MANYQIRPNSAGLTLKIRPNACRHLKNLCKLGLSPKFGLKVKVSKLCVWRAGQRDGLSSIPPPFPSFPPSLLSFLFLQFFSLAVLFPFTLLPSSFFFPFPNSSASLAAKRLGKLSMVLIGSLENHQLRQSSKSVIVSGI